MGFGQSDQEVSGREQGIGRRIRNLELKELLGIDVYNRPTACKECGGVMIYKGVGEYKCEDCGALDYDDYGKARNYVEVHRGATVAEVSEATGVPQKTIRIMLKESRLEITESSRNFLKCEMCGTDIRSGRFCPKCEAEYRRRKDAEARIEKKNMAGYGSEQASEEGEKRFRRNK